MRRAALAFVSTITGLVFLLSFKSHTTSTWRPAAIGAASTGGADTVPSSGSGDGSADSPSATGPSSATEPSSAAKASGVKTVTGDSVDTQWGPVQIRLTVSNGKITDVTAVEYPNGNPRSQEIDPYAIPRLNQEVLAAQSAQIDTVSGATATSEGYIGSLQSALDKAGL